MQVSQELRGHVLLFILGLKKYYCLVGIFKWKMGSGLIIICKQRRFKPETNNSRYRLGLGFDLCSLGRLV